MISLKVVYFSQKEALYLSVRDTISMSPAGDRHFTWSSEPRKAICRAKAVPSFLSHVKTQLSVGLVPGIEPATSRSTVKHSF